MEAHPEKEKFLEYLEGRLPEEEAKPFESHIASCEECARSLREERSLNSLFDSLPPVEPSSNLYDSFRRKLSLYRRRRVVRAFLIPASLAAVLLLAIFTFLPERSSPEAEIMQNIEMFENMELLENYDLYSNLDVLENLANEDLENVDTWISG